MPATYSQMFQKSLEREREKSKTDVVGYLHLENMGKGYRGGYGLTVCVPRSPNSNVGNPILQCVMA